MLIPRLTSSKPAKHSLDLLRSIKNASEGSPGLHAHVPARSYAHAPPVERCTIFGGSFRQKEKGTLQVTPGPKSPSVLTTVPFKNSIPLEDIMSSTSTGAISLPENQLNDAPFLAGRSANGDIPNIPGIINALEKEKSINSSPGVSHVASSEDATPRTYVRNVWNNASGDMLSEENPDVKYGNSLVSPAEDAEYMSLAKKQNRTEDENARLQQMVETAAEKSMPNSKLRDKNGKLMLFYHGTNQGDFS